MSNLTSSGEIFVLWMNRLQYEEIVEGLKKGESHILHGMECEFRLDEDHVLILRIPIKPQ